MWKKAFYGDTPWDKNMTAYGPHRILKTNASIMERLKPEIFKPKAGHSQKTALGYHDLSALLLNPDAPISKQQYKTTQANQAYVFMPLSFAMDQAVFQNINMLGKLFRNDKPDFYDKVRDIRSKMTRIKLLAEHDMATKFVMVGKSQITGLPKFKYVLASVTDISVRDETSGVVPEGTFKSYLTEMRLEDALNPNHKSNQENHPTLATDYPDLKLGTRKTKLVTWLKNELKPLTRHPAKELRADALETEIKNLLNGTKAQERVAKEMKPPPTKEQLDFYIELLVNKAGGKTKNTYATTPRIYEARQNAAINFETLVLGEIMRYAEVTISYRHHAGDFPKFAKFDQQHNVWMVGTINAQNTWTDTAETFPDKPA
jgi:hypothetical protein